MRKGDVSYHVQLNKYWDSLETEEDAEAVYRELLPNLQQVPRSGRIRISFGGIRPSREFLEIVFGRLAREHPQIARRIKLGGSVPGRTGYSDFMIDEDFRIVPLGERH